MLTLFLVLIVLFIIAVVLFINREVLFVKKFWKYLLVLFPLSVYLMQKGVYRVKKRTRAHTSDRMDTSEVLAETNLEHKIEDLKDRLGEVNMEAAIEVSAAQTKNEQKVSQLEEAKKIKDKSERRKRLASLMS